MSNNKKTPLDPLRKGELNEFERSVLHTQTFVVLICASSVDGHLKNITKILTKSILRPVTFYMSAVATGAFISWGYS